MSAREDGDRIAPDAVVEALTRAPFAYTDGTAQVFTADGRTTFTERNGATTSGEWGVDEKGRFWSFWPPSYRAEYDVSWVIDEGETVGVRFVELARGTISVGRYARV
ncbi:hypothetical protein [Microbacterium sp. NPDC058345]|uniref:hypothetical protein n=1 Tax=Microbacterium sp. NPDC058345 TaxID=3346455 RepID=UPI0036475E5F